MSDKEKTSLIAGGIAIGLSVISHFVWIAGFHLTGFLIGMFAVLLFIGALLQ